MSITGDAGMTNREPATLTVPAPSPTAGLPSYPSQSQSHGHYPQSHLIRVSQTTAVWALVLAVIPIPIGWLVSIGLAISVVSQSRDGRGRERGRGLAVAALVIAPLWIVAFVGLMVVSAAASPERDGAGSVTASGDATVDSLKTGDCLAELPDTARHARTIRIVPCSHRHVGQVFAEFDLQKGAYPGDSDIARLAEGGCTKRFDGQFARAADRDRMRLFYYHPLASSWRLSRQVTCIAATVGSDA
jgi:hypothetical protein